MYEEDEIFYRQYRDEQQKDLMPPEVSIKRVVAFMVVGLVFSFIIIMPGCS